MSKIVVQARQLTADDERITEELRKRGFTFRREQYGRDTRMICTKPTRTSRRRSLPVIDGN